MCTKCQLCEKTESKFLVSIKQVEATIKELNHDEVICKSCLIKAIDTKRLEDLESDNSLSIAFCQRVLSEKFIYIPMTFSSFLVELAIAKSTFDYNESRYIKLKFLKHYVVAERYLIVEPATLKEAIIELELDSDFIFMIKTQSNKEYEHAI